MECYNKLRKYCNKYKRQGVKQLNIYRALRNQKDKDRWLKRKISKDYFLHKQICNWWKNKREKTSTSPVLTETQIKTKKRYVLSA